MNLLHYFAFILGFGCHLFLQAECVSECSSLDCMDSGCSTVTNGLDCYYYFPSIKANWSEALKYCQERHMHGAIVNSAQTSEILKRNSMDEAWLAGRSHYLNKWTFVNGKDASSLLESSNITQCVILSWHQEEGSFKPTLTFSTQPCYGRQRFFCRFDDCPLLQRGCTVLSTVRIGWFEARRICKENGGDLLYLTNEERSEDLMAVVYNGLYGDEGEAYIGVHHRKWTWHLPDGSQQEMGYANWYFNQPSKSGDCIQLQYYDKWKSDNCSNHRKVICMRHLHTPPVETPVVGFGNQGVMEIHSGKDRNGDHQNSAQADVDKQGNCKENVAVNSIVLSVAIGSSVLMLGLIAFIMCRGLKGATSNQRNSSSSVKLREVSSWVEEDDDQVKREPRELTTELTTPVAVQSKIRTPVYETVEELRYGDVKQMKDDQSPGAFCNTKHGRPKAADNFYHDLHLNNKPHWCSQTSHRPGAMGLFKPDNNFQAENNDYAEIDDKNSRAPNPLINTPRRDRDPHGGANRYFGDVRYSNVSKVPKLSVDDGETILVDNQIYA